MADYSNVTVGGKRLLKVRLGNKVIWEAEHLPVQPEPKDEPDQEKDEADDR